MSATAAVLPFNQAKRQSQVAAQRAARAAIDEFIRLAESKYRLRWVSLTGYDLNDTLIRVDSHDLCSGAIHLDVSIRTKTEREGAS